MKIRPFQSDDATALAQIFYSAIHEVASRHYTAEQIDAWAPRVPDADNFKVRGTDGRLLLVAVDDNGRPMAYADVEKDGHIDHFFCRPDVAGTGVGKQLYAELEAGAAERGIEILYAEASEPARRFFVKHGFEIEASQELDVAGVKLPYYIMTKRLDEKAARVPGPDPA